jgi:hypothetical protein
LYHIYIHQTKASYFAKRRICCKYI